MKTKLIGALVLIAIVAGAALYYTGQIGPVANAAEIVVYKDPQCGCCSKWVDHLRAHGFRVKTHDDPAVHKIKEANGLPHELGSCHTALVEGYVVEGHVPAHTIQRLLSERPPIKGIAVAGMPPGSPGMESPHPKPYDVMSFDAAGKIDVYEKR